MATTPVHAIATGALHETDLVREALAKPLVREVALRAGKVGTAQRALVLQMLEHAEQVLQELTASPAAPPAEAPRHSRPEEPTQEEG